MFFYVVILFEAIKYCMWYSLSIFIYKGKGIGGKIRLWLHPLGMQSTVYTLLSISSSFFWNALYCLLFLLMIESYSQKYINNNMQNHLLRDSCPVQCSDSRARTWSVLELVHSIWCTHARGAKLATPKSISTRPPKQRPAQAILRPFGGRRHRFRYGGRRFPSRAPILNLNLGELW
jgi:hypothetical protein